MEEQSVIVERVFMVSRPLVWQALTDKEIMKQWCFNLGEFDAVVGFKFEFMGDPEDGIQYKQLCEITEVVPEKKLTYSWRYEGCQGISYVSFELFEENENTRLKLTHTGFETFLADMSYFNTHNFEAGGNNIINRSPKEFLERNHQ